MAFSVFVEMLNIRLRKRAAMPVELHKAYVREATPATQPSREKSRDG